LDSRHERFFWGTWASGDPFFRIHLRKTMRLPSLQASRERARPVCAPRTRAGSRLTGEGLEALLRTLHPDREGAAARYEMLRRKLIRLFACRGCAAPDELTDETLDRVGRTLSGPRELSGELGGFVHGVALNVLREWWRRRPADAPPVDLERLASPPAPAADSTDERRLLCLEACLDALPSEERDLILRYYRSDERVLIGTRRDLARQLGIGMNALRIRAHRIRIRLEGSLRCRLAAVENELGE
jgi:DNA-directed RNA polymerase specialized sigma24 family protein